MEDKIGRAQAQATGAATNRPSMLVPRQPSDPICLAGSKHGARCLATIEREFYRSARGPAPTDEDAWRLVFDQRAMRLLVRHEWDAAGHNGVDEFEIAEFLAQDGAAPAELIKILFGRVPANA